MGGAPPALGFCLSQGPAHGTTVGISGLSPLEPVLKPYCGQFTVDLPNLSIVLGGFFLTKTHDLGFVKDFVLNLCYLSLL